MSLTLQGLVDVAENLVEFSTTAMEISRIARDDEAGMPELVFAVEADSSFSLKILRLANSPVYLRGERTSSIAQAIMRVGRLEIAQLAFASACIEGMQNFHGDLLQVECLWQDGMIIGAIARELSVLAPRAREYSYAAGMLHGIGSVVLNTQMPVQMRESLNMSLIEDLPLHVCEKKILGFSHADLGGAMARRWNFPEPLVCAVEFQHSPRDTPAHDDVVSVVAIALALLEYSLLLDEFGPDTHSIFCLLDSLGVRQKFVDAQLNATDILQKAYESEGFIA